MGFLIPILLAMHMGDLFGKESFGRKSMLIGAFFSLLLDLPSFGSDTLDLFDREHAHNWSHSIFAVILYVLIIMGLSFLGKKEPFPLLNVAIPVFFVHLLFDAGTTNGMPLFFPFSEQAIGWDVISRFDIIIGTTLFISTIFIYRFPIFKSQYTLFFLSCYTLFSLGLSLQARQSVLPILSQMGFPSQNIHITSPSLLFPIRRVTAIDPNHRLAVSYVSPFSIRPPRFYVRESEYNPQIFSLLQSDIGQRLLQISSSMIFIERVDNRYLFSDIRFGGFHEIWDSPLRIQSIIDKGSALPLEHVPFYSKTPLFEDLSEGWNFLFP